MTSVLIQTSLHKFKNYAQYLKWLCSLFKIIPLIHRIIVYRSPKREIKLFQQQANYFSSFSKGISFIPLARFSVLCLERYVIYTCILVQVDVTFFFVIVVDFSFSIFHFSMFAKTSYFSYSSTCESLLLSPCSLLKEDYSGYSVIYMLLKGEKLNLCIRIFIAYNNLK